MSLKTSLVVSYSLEHVLKTAYFFAQSSKLKHENAEGDITLRK